eukprot:scaffold5572_cov390-Prasinococcus_capsulatus_cf.AAC.5
MIGEPPADDGCRGLANQAQIALPDLGALESSKGAVNKIGGVNGKTSDMDGMQHQDSTNSQGAVDAVQNILSSAKGGAAITEKAMPENKVATSSSQPHSPAQKLDRDMTTPNALARDSLWNDNPSHTLDDTLVAKVQV